MRHLSIEIIAIPNLQLFAGNSELDVKSKRDLFYVV